MMTSKNHLAPPDAATTPAPMRRPLPGTLPGAATYLVLAIWSGLVTAAVVAGVFAGDGASRLALPAAVVIPIAAVAIGYRASPRLRNYLLRLDLRLLLAAQLWRVIGFAFLVTLAYDQLPAGFAVPAAVGDLATGIAAFAVVLALEPPALTTWPMAIFPTIMVPFFAVLHLVAVLQSRRDWEARARQFAIPSHDLAPSA
jgi:hypothetical protein